MKLKKKNFPFRFFLKSFKSLCSQLYIYICVCVCVCMCVGNEAWLLDKSNLEFTTNRKNDP